MSTQVFSVDEPLIEELRGVFQVKEDVYSVIKYLAEKCGIRRPKTGWESLVLFGTVARDGTGIEEVAGDLVYLSKGLVVFVSNREDHILSGLLEKCGPLTTQLFAVRGFNPHTSTYIWPHDPRRFKDCPVWVSRDFGPEQAGADLGIDKFRWLVMRRTLGKWLPKHQ